VVAVEGDDAVVTSVRVGLGGELREPTMIRRELVVDGLRRGKDARWVPATRERAGTDLDLDPATLLAGPDPVGVLTASPKSGNDRDMLVAVLDLLARYGRCSDATPSGAGWRDCFVDDAVVTSFSPRADRPPAVLQGRAVIEDAFARVARPASTVHVVADVVIERDRTADAGTRGAVTIDSRFVRLDRTGQNTVIGSFGRYLDRAVRCDDELWRLARREIHLAGRRSPAPSG
jgi:hypothetical protein